VHGVEPHAGSLVSGEGVRLALSSAGAGSRIVAAALDAMIQFAALIVLLLLTQLIGTTDTAALAAIVIVELVLVVAGYPIVMEWLTRGRTVGKLVFGLRVVRDDGGPIGFRQALVRGLAGLVLEKPGLLAPLSTAAGVVTMSVSAREKRLGDMLAGTVVLNERSVPPPVPPPLWVPVPLQPWVLSLDLSRLDDRLALSLREFVGRAYGMTPVAQHALGDDLRRRLLAVVAPPPPPFAPTPDVLMSVLAERRRRAASGETGPWRPASGAAAVATSGPFPPPVGGPFTAPG
jgi:uncharacterized RDD family membrane protein YckC